MVGPPTCIMWNHLVARVPCVVMVSLLFTILQHTAISVTAHGGHDDHHHDDKHHDDRNHGESHSQQQTEAEVFLQSLFNKYGENGLMTFEGFEHLLQSLGIGNVNIRDHDLRAHRTNGSFVTFHGDHNHNMVMPLAAGGNHSHDGNGDIGHGMDHKDSSHGHADSDHGHPGSSHGDSSHVSGSDIHRGEDVQTLLETGVHSSGHAKEKADSGHLHVDNGHVHAGSGNEDSHMTGSERSEDENLPGGSKEHEESGHVHEKSGHVHGKSGHVHDESGHVHDESGHVHDESGHVHDKSGHVHEDSGHGQEASGHGQEASGHGQEASDNGHKHLEGQGTLTSNISLSDQSHQSLHLGLKLHHDAHARNHSHHHHKGNHTSTRHHHHIHLNNGTSANTSETHHHTRQHQANKNKKRGKQGKNDIVVPPSAMAPTTPTSDQTPNGTTVGAVRIRRELSPNGGSNLHEDSEHMDSHIGDSPKTDVRPSITRAKDADIQTRSQTCMTAAQILSAFHVQSEEGITPDTFLTLCPAIVYQIDRHACHEPSRHLAGHKHVTVTKPAHQGYADPKVWGYAIAAVTVISLVGLLSVALVPVLQKAFYHHLIQFLVSLAVGSLTGDALLHLIPHALSKGHEDEGGGHNHESGSPANNDPVWKGMLALSGIYLFFLMERGMAGYQQWKAARRKNKQFCRKKVRRAPSDKPRRMSWRFSAIGQKLCEYNKVAFSREDMGNLSKHEARFIEETFELNDIDDLTLNHGDGHDHSDGHGHSEAKSHGHSHGDGVIPSSVTAIAWMVIAGDGLHNFSDGLAIGAGFANSLTGGLSTSVAVFCHELPHELGDFAVLLQSGMSVRQALFYNVVSSVLCFLGMVIGVIVGNIGEASLWIFAMTAGTFIYISLVDMLPEVTTALARTTGGKLCMVLLQGLGLTAGVSIMLVIALFEHRIKIDVST